VAKYLYPSENNASLGRKRFGDGLFYEQTAPLGLKRFGDGLFYKQAAPLGLKKFCLMIYSLITLSFYLQNLTPK
jgi:hypothetical protein